MIFLYVPSSAVRETVRLLKDIVSKDCIFISTAKDIGKDSYKRMTPIMEEITNWCPVAFLGSNMSGGFLKNFIVATIIVCSDDYYFNKVKDIIVTDTFKVNMDDDVIGTEFYGIIKKYFGYV